jgi:hypothetical protein
MGDLHEPRRTTRREVLKKSAFVAGAAWATPVIQSITTPAFAVGTPPPTGCEEPCNAQCSPGFPTCGVGGPRGNCRCSPSVAGECFCWADADCQDLTPAVDGSICPPGTVAVSTCCDQVGGYPILCLHPCDPSGASVTTAQGTGFTASGE